jgi:hypothetical protein
MPRRRRAKAGSGMRVQGETEAVSSWAIFRASKRGRLVLDGRAPDRPTLRGMGHRPTPRSASKLPSPFRQFPHLRESALPALDISIVGKESARVSLRPISICTTVRIMV